MIARWSFVMALVLSPWVAMAQPLGDKVPADAVLYFGWQGADHLPAAYQQSHLKGVLDSSRFPEFFNTAMPALIARVAQEDQQAAAALKMFSAIAGPMWRHPCAFYSSGVDLGGGMPVPRFAVICQAGAEADAVLQQLSTLLQQANAQAAPFPVKSFKDGEVVGLIVGYADEKAAMAADASKSLASAEGFKAAMGQVHKEPVCALYVDAEGIVAQVDNAVKTFGQPREQQEWGKFRNAIGLDGIKRMILTGAFEGQDWGSQCFIAAPGPRTGIASLLDAQPLTDEALKSIPATATVAGVARFNVARFFQEVRTAAGKIDPQAQQMMDQGMGVAQMALAMNLEKDLFQSLGDEWVFYADPQSGGRGLLGLTVVNRLANADNANRALKKLEMAMDNGINGQIPPREKIRINFESFTSGDLKIHYVAVPFVSPSWAIRDNYLFAGLYPQIVAAASENAKGKSILDNPDFVALRKRLGAEKATSFSYFDLPRTVEDNYQFLLLGSQGAFGAADMFGVKTPPMVMPSLKALRTHLTPAASFGWTDEAGWHSHGVSPIPGGELLASQGSVIMAVPLLAGIALPATYKARAQARNVQAMSNLKQIGVAAMMYANDNQGKYPADLGTLLIAGDLHLDAFVSPGVTQIPPDVRGAKREDQAAWVNEHSDYVWVGATLKPGDGAGQVIAYEKAEASRDGTTPLLFNDGHVEIRSTAMALDLVRQQGRGK